MVKVIQQYGKFCSTLKDSVNLYCEKINVSTNYKSTNYKQLVYQLKSLKDVINFLLQYLML